MVETNRHKYNELEFLTEQQKNQRTGSLKRKETAMLIISPSHLPPSYFGCPSSIRRAVNTLEQHSELTYEAGLRLPVLDGVRPQQVLIGQLYIILTDSFNHNVQVQNKFMRGVYIRDTKLFTT